jgi:pimeloyl-ACP methyl ester carboxylesterase
MSKQKSSGALPASALVPALYIAGDHDMVVAFPGAAEHIANMKQGRASGCGHWTQQERPEEVNATIIEFLRSVPS